MAVTIGEIRTATCQHCGIVIHWRYMLPAGWHWAHVVANWAGQYPHVPEPQEVAANA